MATFTDKFNRTWVVEIDPPAIEAVAKRLDGLRIDQVLMQEGAGLKTLFGDVLRFVRVLWVLVEDQAEKGGVKPEQFGKGLVGDHLESAARCFLEAFADFSPSHQRKVLKALVAKGDEVTAKETALAMAKIAAIGTKTDATSSSSATRSPASSDSTRVVVEG